MNSDYQILFPGIEWYKITDIVDKIYEGDINGLSYEFENFINSIGFSNMDIYFDLSKNIWSPNEEEQPYWPLFLTIKPKSNITIYLEPLLRLSKKIELAHALRRLFNIIGIFCLCVERFKREKTIYISLGDWTAEYAIGFNPRTNNAIAIPDVDYLNSHAYKNIKTKLERNNISWKNKIPEFYWRGDISTSKNDFLSNLVDYNHKKYCPRIALITKSKNISNMNCKIIENFEDEIGTKIIDYVKDENIFCKNVAFEDSNFFRYSFDIDNHSNDWKGLFSKFLFGNTILKVGSHQGFFQWYYDKLIQWTNFIPIEPDLSDLNEKIDWCISHQELCEAIASSGSKLASMLDLKYSVDQAVCRIMAAPDASIIF
ncbi:hypothetical protein DA075_34815 (plasmid) [Methylobacterium currus]|uniref:Glycosyl transferase CAP10 domain-containing protein n=1 Tax=Methylobacterium currus TaxID=2051553 RepID=A0A2R4WX73_9HYPH|nr:glycosyl transferase family 90 [Methylobacterium currus]AWB26149.1 hypothetical protein DA075_34815 [Methylobacterium currus]